MSRIDCSNYLIHFTKGKNLEDSYTIFKKIIKDSKLICGTGFIKEDECCICFTEAPINCLKNDGTLDNEYFTRYSPFGFLFKKEFIYFNGGRPVIYSGSNEYEILPNEMKWRYVRYEPNHKPKPIDFTWEREWRLKEKELMLTGDNVKLIFPDNKWITRFKEEHYQEEHLKYEKCKCDRTTKVIEYSKLFNPETAEETIETCPEPSDLPWVLSAMTKG